VLQRVAVTWCACATCNICVTDIRSTMTVMLQCVAVYSCCSVLQRVAVYLCCSVLQCIRVAVCCSVFVLQCVVMCCSALRCVVMTQCACATCNIRMTDIRSMISAMLQCVAVYSCGSVLQCVAVCCSVLQCVVVWCRVLQCVAVIWCACATCNIRVTDIRSTTTVFQRLEFLCVYKHKYIYIYKYQGVHLSKYIHYVYI